MSELPDVTPRFAPQPTGVAWPTLEWPRGTSPHQEELDEVVDQMFSDDALAITNAVVVIQGGRVLVERYGGEQFFFDRPAEPITAHSALLSWSMAKSVLHMIVGTLVDEHRLGPDQLAPVPEWSDPSDPRHRIRVRDLLAMRDGLAFIEQYVLGETSHVIEMLYGEGKDDMAAYTAQLPLAHEPDTFFNYSSGTTNVLSRIVAELVGYGDSYQAYLTRGASSWRRVSCTPTPWTSRVSDSSTCAGASGRATSWSRATGRRRPRSRRVAMRRAARSTRGSGGSPVTSTARTGPAATRAR
jgi:CubicO group peptidase (beta-lactamase class C family)